MQELWMMVKTNKHRFDTAEEKAAYKAQIRAATSDVDTATFEGINKVLAEAQYIAKLETISNSFQAGDEIDVVGKANRALAELKTTMKVSDNIHEFVDDPIEKIIEEMTDEDTGISFRAKPLREHLRPTRGGDFIILAARPDQGKTSFVCSEITYMAAQSKRPILWFNNEGVGKRIYPRLYQAALSVTFPELVSLNEKGQLSSRYAESIGSQDPFHIRIKDIHGYSISQVEQVIEQVNPGVVVYDMIDNIHGFGGESRQDLQLESMYQYCRELAVIHDHVGIATSQISADGDGLLYPTQSMLKDSKTGKQGACDAIIMLGHSNDPNLQSVRGISTPKNKLMLAGKQKDPRTEVYFDAAKCVFT